MHEPVGGLMENRLAFFLGLGQNKGLECSVTEKVYNKSLSQGSCFVFATDSPQSCISFFFLKNAKPVSVH